MKWDYSNVDRDATYVDVDGTLLLWPGRYGDGTPKINAPLIAHLIREHKRGVLIYLWSRAGAVHAHMAAKFCGIDHIVTAHLQKPQRTHDDDYGWMDAIQRLPPSPPEPKLIVRRA